MRDVKSPVHSSTIATTIAGTPPSSVSQKTRCSCCGLEAMALEPAIERAAREAQRLGRLAHIAAGACQRLLDQRAFDILETHLVQRAGAIRPSAETKIACANRPTFGHQHRAFHGVIQLTHVARP